MAYQTLPYNQSLSLLTDLYQLTMAYGYWKNGLAERESVFHLFYRVNPFKGGFAISCGLAYVIDFIKQFKFSSSDIEYLQSLQGNDDKPLFDAEFLKYLFNLRFTGSLDAIPEGTVIFPQEPILRVRGPLLQCQILETALLNMINFQSLIATKAARICLAAGEQPVLEFGLRRAQGMDGALAASRAAYIGGCFATSNVLAGKMFGIPVKGTHAHSWVMSFEDETQAFRAYAGAMPNNCVFLVDTYHTLEGVKKAIEAGRVLRQKGFELGGIRLDSGDLAYLSIEARKILDEAGFPNAKIIASNDLDESIIDSLRDQGAKIDIWGVGTKLVTAYDHPALGGVYKLSAIRSPEGPWKYKIKLSEQLIKISTPGILQVRRFFKDQEYRADMIYDVDTKWGRETVMIDPKDQTRQRTVTDYFQEKDLLVPVFDQGKLIYHQPSLDTIRDLCRAELGHIHAGVKRLVHPHQYPVGLEKSLCDLKTRLVLEARQGIHRDPVEK